MKVKSDATPSLVLLATRVPPQTKADFERLAEKHRRSITAQLRVLVERELEEAI